MAIENGCNMCGKKDTIMYDARTHGLGWAYLCQDHFKEFGIGLGAGLGQKYEYNHSTGYKKVEG